MTRRTIDPFISLAAGILLLTGQSFLLIPQHQGGIIGGVSSYTAYAVGFVFFLTGLAGFCLLPLPARPWKIMLVNIALPALLGTLTLIYIEARLWVEVGLLGGLAVIIPVLAFGNRGITQTRRDLFTGFASILNLIVGSGLLAWNGLFQTAAYQGLLSQRYALSVLFLATALAGGFAVLDRRHEYPRGFAKLVAIPWIAWGGLLTLARSTPNLIPAGCLAVLLLVADTIPWARLRLPEKDVLGRRMILLAVIAQTAFLAAVTFLLDRVEIVHVSSIGGAGLFLLSSRELAFLMNLGTEIVLGYGLISLIITINELVARMARGPDASQNPAAEQEDGNANWSKRVARLISPFTSSQMEPQSRFELQAQQIASLDGQLALEKRRTSQLTLLSELSQQLENQLDAPVASQLAVNTLQRALSCSLTALYIHAPERHELVALASAGTRANMLPPGYRQNIRTGLLGRTARLRKTQIVNDARLEPDFIWLGEEEETLSSVAVPLIDHGHLKAVLEVSDDRVSAFSGSDVQIAEAIASELLRAWERSDYHQRLTELIQAGISLTAQPEPQAAVREVATIARQTLRARFTFVTLLDQEGKFTRTASAGQAPRLLKSLGRSPTQEPLMQAALNTANPFRVRDVRRYKHASHIDIDFSGLRSLIAIPIRMHNLSVGAILAFGKQGEVFFTENDESLASLLSSQAAAAIESAWLSHELRTNLTSTTQLYQLSFHVIQAEALTEAARYIAETAQKVCTASSTGIVLLTPDRKIEAEVQLEADGTHVTPKPPMEIIERALESGQSIFISSENDTSSVCFPLKTPTRTYGALWLILPDRNSARFATNLQTLANQAAVALERSILLVESRQQAKELEAAYRELELTYDHTLAALTSALDARDRETEGHSMRVSHLARALGEKLKLHAAQLKALERGSLLHDIGKIGISDMLLHKPGPLDANEWKIMHMHPDIGARIVEGIPFLQEALSIVRYHQERWDGSGYPVGLSGKDIPYLARIFAVADAFDALTSDRPYRTRIQPEEAIQYLREQAGILFDPEIINILDQLASQGQLADISPEP
jgi:putative nucleotidyltransferase with HDIG domain